MYTTIQGVSFLFIYKELCKTFRNFFELAPKTARPSIFIPTTFL